MKQTESKLQIACVRWFRYEYKRYSNVFFAIPNGGNRNAVTGAILKAEGVLAGVADLFLSLPRNGFHGLYIEMKCGKNNQTATQQLFQSEVEKHGYKYIVVRSFDEFQRELNYYTNGLITPSYHV